eukprot:364197-Chlamydomonas_euryale.AAC.18
MAHRVSGSHPLLQLGLQLGFGEGTTRAVMVRLAAAHTRGEPCRLTLTHQDIFLDALTGGGGGECRMAPRVMRKEVGTTCEHKQHTYVIKSGCCLDPSSN